MRANMQARSEKKRVQESNENVNGIRAKTRAKSKQAVSERQENANKNLNVSEKPAS